MALYVFDLFLIELKISQLQEVLIVMAKSGLAGGVYLWINRSNGVCRLLN